MNHRLLHHFSYLDGAIIHVDPVEEAGEEHYRISAHSYDGLPTHSHQGRTSESPSTHSGEDAP